ncbi:transporter [Tabrizicola sp. BL-A-41-H6]|uniref:transporter n=1 Tax=Tabrizicola sp. BL-A-41-H6 TaxID=3421107 RepID=UPI003D67284A
MHGTARHQGSVGRAYRQHRVEILVFACFSVGLAGPVLGQDADLAKQLSNPISSLVSVPLQYNYNEGFLGGDGEQHVLNIQPVIPFSISEDWNLISRTIVPLIDQTGVVPGQGNKSGVGGITQSFFFSPKAPTKNGLIWGVGPVITTPSLTDGLGSEQWGLGLTAVALKQSGPLTVGFLGNHVWSVTDNDIYGDASNTFLQPFLSYTTPKATTFGINTEAVYNWTTEDWAVPINVTVAQLLTLGDQPVQITGGVRYWADSADNGPEGWGARLALTYLFPKG